MKIRVLGSGSSFGSPLAWGRNGNIDINNLNNFRTRSSILIEINNTNILIDTSPDLRQQLYSAKCTNIDAVLFTHIHSDHTSGLPDMRAISLINDKIIPAYMPKDMKDKILSHYKFIFKGDKDYRPFMEVRDIQNKFFINNIEIQTFKHNHGSIDVQTYRIGKFAYSTDLKNFYENDLDNLQDLDLWVVGLLRSDPHPSHAGFEQILDYIKYIKPKKTIFTHMTALLDEEKLISKCPKNVLPAFDGMEIEI
ncbi:MAG TPA: MBL fold metallo-hydrolase [Pelagibacterales bacterium]|jgi:phosphoribosyl 1,2-cyclic phosphate phosphodiesterase|nr:MBL fold metallo-hydrolase [Pelagibacterales bacterium]